MSWALGQNRDRRDVGYGVPAVCDHPDCNAEIDRGLPRVCGGMHDGDEEGCGLYFCGQHLRYGLFGSENMAAEEEDEAEQKYARAYTYVCERCYQGNHEHFKPKPDTAEWIKHKLIDPTWQEWRDKNLEWVFKHV